MSLTSEIISTIRAASAKAQADYDAARHGMLDLHEAEANALQVRQTSEAAALDAAHTSKIAYLGNLVAVPVPADLAFVAE